MNFSVVITTYNRLDLLKRAIESALSQTVACETIVADDCSTDGTQEYVTRLQESMRKQGDDRLIYHRNASNLGHSLTMNAGVKMARGEWIKPLDDDDYLAQNCIEEMSQAIALRPQAVICSCQAAQVDAQEVELSCTPKTGPGKAFYIPQEDIHYGMLLEMVPFGTPVQVAFRKNIFWQAGGWDSRFDGNCDDIDSWIKIAQFGDAVFLNQCLSYRTIWPGAYNHRFSVQKRMDTNILMKQKIHTLVNQKYHDDRPEIKDVRDYLKLHWSFVSLKQGQFLSTIVTAFPAIFSFTAWKLLVKAILFRHKPWTAQNKLFAKYADELFSQSPELLNSEQKWRTHHNILDVLKDFQVSERRPMLKKIKFWHILKLKSQVIFSSEHRPISKYVDRNRDKSENRHNKIALQLDTNINILDNLYQFIQTHQKENLPQVKVVRAYIQLRWSWAAIKQKKLISGIKIAFPAIFSIPAWRIFFAAIESDYREKRHNKIRKLVLIDD
ncbi:glycosyltransferase family 2 protein [Oscillatoriales cyanobacterium LEGE 11467]|uniref:Glycosyltransferase family 2 protein n=1 Tax=Zarconia navalis LEGE 11467 TaxID=1828826 RepID=A0A928VZ27_9CYAN|nr:glycosyltransferase family 2 protein [Zarconia navalis]MBE9042254.1 glycosyltransferase family 2 protein [Zarconia navalis LEGE 11467]